METTDAYGEETAALRRFLAMGVDDGAIACYHDTLAARRPGWGLSRGPHSAELSAAAWIELVLAAPGARARRYLVYRAVLRPGAGGLWHAVSSGSGFDMPALLADLGLSSQPEASARDENRFDEVLARIARHDQLRLDGSALPEGPDSSPFAYVYATHLHSGTELTLCLDVHMDGTCRLHSSGVGEPYRLVAPS